MPLTAEERLSKTIGAESKKKYDQALARIKTAGYDAEKQPKEVIEWINFLFHVWRAADHPDGARDAV
jgi:hypothetical protein